MRSKTCNLQPGSSSQNLDGSDDDQELIIELEEEMEVLDSIGHRSTVKRKNSFCETLILIRDCEGRLQLFSSSHQMHYGKGHKKLIFSCYGARS